MSRTSFEDLSAWASSVGILCDAMENTLQKVDGTNKLKTPGEINKELSAEDGEISEILSFIENYEECSEAHDAESEDEYSLRMEAVNAESGSMHENIASTPMEPGEIREYPRVQSNISITIREMFDIDCSQKSGENINSNDKKEDLLPDNNHHPGKYETEVNTNNHSHSKQNKELFQKDNNKQTLELAFSVHRKEHTVKEKIASGKEENISKKREHFFDSLNEDSCGQNKCTSKEHYECNDSKSPETNHSKSLNLNKGSHGYSVRVYSNVKNMPLINKNNVLSSANGSDSSGSDLNGFSSGKDEQNKNMQKSQKIETENNSPKNKTQIPAIVHNYVHSKEKSDYVRPKTPAIKQSSRIDKLSPKVHASGSVEKKTQQNNHISTNTEKGHISGASETKQASKSNENRRKSERPKREEVKKKLNGQKAVSEVTATNRHYVTRQSARDTDRKRKSIESIEIPAKRVSSEADKNLDSVEKDTSDTGFNTNDNKKGRVPKKTSKIVKTDTTKTQDTIKEAGAKNNAQKISVRSVEVTQRKVAHVLVQPIPVYVKGKTVQLQNTSANKLLKDRNSESHSKASNNDTDETLSSEESVLIIPTRNAGRMKRDESPHSANSDKSCDGKLVIVKEYCTNSNAKPRYYVETESALRNIQGSGEHSKTITSDITNRNTTKSLKNISPKSMQEEPWLRHYERPQKTECIPQNDKKQSSEQGELLLKKRGRPRKQVLENRARPRKQVIKTRAVADAELNEHPSTSQQNEESTNRNDRHSTGKSQNTNKSKESLGHALTQMELDVLKFKYTRDGHFRVNPNQPLLSNNDIKVERGGQSYMQQRSETNNISQPRVNQNSNMNAFGLPFVINNAMRSDNSKNVTNFGIQVDGINANRSRTDFIESCPNLLDNMSTVNLPYRDVRSPNVNSRNELNSRNYGTVFSENMRKSNNVQCTNTGQYQSEDMFQNIRDLNAGQRNNSAMMNFRPPANCTVVNSNSANLPWNTSNVREASSSIQYNYGLDLTNESSGVNNPTASMNHNNPNSVLSNLNENSNYTQRIINPQSHMSRGMTTSTPLSSSSRSSISMTDAQNGLNNFINPSFPVLPPWNNAQAMCNPSGASHYFNNMYNPYNPFYGVDMANFSAMNNRNFMGNGMSPWMPNPFQYMHNGNLSGLSPTFNNSCPMEIPSTHVLPNVGNATSLPNVNTILPRRHTVTKFNANVPNEQGIFGNILNASFQDSGTNNYNHQSTYPCNQASNYTTCLSQQRDDMQIGHMKSTEMQINGNNCLQESFPGNIQHDTADCSIYNGNGVLENYPSNGEQLDTSDCEIVAELRKTNQARQEVVDFARQYDGDLMTNSISIPLVDDNEMYV